MIGLNKIDAVLREADIEGLIRIHGTPGDEYSSEAEEIYTGLKLLKAEEIIEENITAIVSSIWALSFNLDADGLKLRMPAIIETAKKILV